MKKTPKKLRLSKETLCELDTLKDVAGGATFTNLCTRTCNTSHNTCTTFLC
jgi:hypothetical protein